LLDPLKGRGVLRKSGSRSAEGNQCANNTTEAKHAWKLPFPDAASPV
jgi:hypothetical protein